MSYRTEEFTGLRGAAITLVIVSYAEHTAANGYHGWLAALRGFVNGRLGVLILFVLSGFLVIDLLQREWQRAGKSIDRSFI
ncbi:hypothetical protein [Burkholderia sp. TSV86]|uniref:hypothetical protein n=1 Tax=Burkholderia sp. TSV86 TaxID=1385594 RepID=UPI0007566F85|nr:hypothetical protein [Burkholderia sp. TSV86]KVE33811.1 hypothetical protein WS68_11655 [Burkholderia sp. TSV86]